MVKVSNKCSICLLFVRLPGSAYWLSLTEGHYHYFAMNFVEMLTIKEEERRIIEHFVLYCVFCTSQHLIAFSQIEHYYIHANVVLLHENIDRFKVGFKSNSTIIESIPKFNNYYEQTIKSSLSRNTIHFVVFHPLLVFLLLLMIFSCVHLFQCINILIGFWITIFKLLIYTSFYKPMCIKTFFVIQRFLFDLKNQFGLSTAITVQYIIFSYAAMKIGIRVLILAIGCYLYAITMSKCIK